MSGHRSVLIYHNVHDSSTESVLKNNISVAEQQQLTAMRSQLIQDRFLKRVAMLDAELGLINQIEILFPIADFEAVRQFSTFFSNAVIASNSKNIEQLKAAVNQIIDSKILDSLWTTLKTIQA